MIIILDTKELMQNIINKAINSGASDIHIYPNNYIKLRIKGNLHEIEKFSNVEIESIISLLKFNASIDISLNKEPQSGRFEYVLNDKTYYLRVSTLPLNELQEGCVIRIFTDVIEDVNYSFFGEDVEKILSLANKANGLIIFSGPTGSGKSTSMYKLSIDIANRNKQIISIEDPVEKNIDNIIQMQVNEKAGINYNNALKSILRCDPDVIMVGEIRDRLTAQYVITSAFSGHLVITTLHAEDCIGVVNRLKDLGISTEDIKQTMLCIISQRLVTIGTKQELVTEIMNKESLYNYFENSTKNYLTLKDRFNELYKMEKITSYEKEKWGY